MKLLVSKEVLKDTSGNHSHLTNLKLLDRTFKRWGQHTKPKSTNELEVIKTRIPQEK